MNIFPSVNLSSAGEMLTANFLYCSELKVEKLGVMNMVEITEWAGGWVLETEEVRLSSQLLELYFWDFCFEEF